MGRHAFQKKFSFLMMPILLLMVVICSIQSAAAASQSQWDGLPLPMQSQINKAANKAEQAQKKERAYRADNTCGEPIPSRYTDDSTRRRAYRLYQRVPRYYDRRRYRYAPYSAQYYPYPRYRDRYFDRFDPYYR